MIVCAANIKNVSLNTVTVIFLTSRTYKIIVIMYVSCGKGKSNFAEFYFAALGTWSPHPHFDRDGSTWFWSTRKFPTSTYQLIRVPPASAEDPLHGLQVTRLIYGLFIFYPTYLTRVFPPGFLLGHETFWGLSGGL